MNLTKSAKIQLLATGVLAATGIAYAAGNLDLWTEADEYIYTGDYINNRATIVPVTIPGSQAEQPNYTQFQVTLPAGTGSLREDTRYVGLIQEGSETPVTVALSEADADWLPTKEPEGNLVIENGTRDAIRGKMFTYDIDAQAIFLGE